MSFNQKIIAKNESYSFFKACELLQKELSRFGVEVDAISEASKSKSEDFDSFDVVESCVLSEIDRLSKISDEVTSAGNEIKNLKSFLKDHRFNYSDDLFNKIEDNYFVEVYDSSFKSLYRSPNMYKSTSYAISDLYMFTWTDLFGRREDYNLAIADKIVEAFYANEPKIIEVGVGPHTCYERFSKKMFEAVTHPLCFASIQNDEGLKAVVTLNTAYDFHSKVETRK